MRLALLTLTLVLGQVGAPSVAAAQQSSVSGALGAGVVGDQPAALVDVGLDVSGDDYALGLGGRLRMVGSSGVRQEEWDEPSELARMLRYLTYVRGDTEGPRASFVAGELGDARLGEGAVVDGYASGLDIDHGHLGAQLRVATNHWTAEAIVDDVVRPRLVGTRGGVHALAGIHVGASVAADITAPAMEGTEVLPIASVFAGRDWLSDRLHTYVQVVGVARFAAGLHVGARASLPMAADRVEIHLRGEARLGTDRYVPGWFGPLYELARSGRLAQARRGGMAGRSGMVEAGVELRDRGRIDVAFRQRRRLPDLLSARLALPHARGVQGAFTVMGEDGDAGAARRFVLAAELRARLPSRMYVSFEATHLYRDTPSDPRPVWLASAALGGILGAE